MHATQSPKNDHDSPLDRSRRLMRAAGVIGYNNMHYRLHARRGKSTAHLCHGCGESVAANWAYDHGDPDERFDSLNGNPFSMDVDHYEPMCISCHRAFDSNQPVSRRYVHPRQPEPRVPSLRSPEHIAHVARSRLHDLYLITGVLPTYEQAV